MEKAISRLKEFNFSGRLSVMKPIESFISKRMEDMRYLFVRKAKIYSPQSANLFNGT
jgi:hypothetical protein